MLEKAIPYNVHTKLGHEVNPRIIEYVWAWLYRQNRKNQDGFNCLGALFRK